MSQHKALSDWLEDVSKHFSHLSKPQATILAIFSFAMVAVQSCGNSGIAYFLALLLEEKEGSMRQKLREFCYNAKDKKGEKRCEIDVQTCFVPLFNWILSNWSSDEKRMALALDASTLRQVFTVLSLSVVYRGCAIPVAWIIVPACKKGAWKVHWLNLLQVVKESMPGGWLVIVLTDRGLYAKWLYKAIQKNAWHPFMRINQGGKFRPVGQAGFRALGQVVPCTGSRWSDVIDCFKTKSARLRSTLLARWDEGYSDPWLILTDLAPEQASAAWYGMRGWIEQGFKDCKRGGFRWEQTKMSDPERATRLWLVIAVATLWAVLVGGEADANLSASSLDALPATHVARRNASERPPARRLSCFKRGIIRILVALIKGESLPAGSFIPELWANDSEHIGGFQYGPT